MTHTTESMANAEKIAAGLSRNQRDLLDDLCGCPGLFAGQYVSDGAGIEHLPNELWWQSFTGAAGFLGLGKAFASDLGLAVREILRREA